MDISQYIIIFTILLILSIVYKYLKLDEDTNTSAYYHKMASQYLLNNNSLGMSNKPFLWMHIHNDDSITPKVNSRSWLNFYSRATTDFNQPYQQLTIKSIIDKCGNDFNICLIDDKSFKKLIPNWTIDLNIIAIPIRIRIRLLALSTILNLYGGILVPSSFICFKSLKPLYYNNIIENKMFVGEFCNRTANPTLSSSNFAPSPILMGCNAGNKEMQEFIKVLEIINSQDFTAQPDFLGNINQWLADGIYYNKINSISAKHLGTKKNCGNPLYVDELVGSTFIKLCPEVFGIYIPWNELINRINLQWFVRLSPQQILESNTMIGKYLLTNN